MELDISLKLHRPLTLPLSYHHILQGCIYNLGKAWRFSDELHDGDGPKYFCNSILKGKYHTDKANKTITFTENKVTFHVRSVFDEWIESVYTKAISDGIILNNKRYEINTISKADTHIYADEVRVRMLSPVTVHRTEHNSNGKKHTVFYTPDDEEFTTLINSNFQRKYWELFEADPKSEIEIEYLSDIMKERYVTQFIKKDKTGNKMEYWITAYSGEFRIRSDASTLNLLYDTGLGAKNSMGFGMFEII